MDNTTRNQAPVWLFAAICLLTIVIYWPGLSGDYMFDDLPNLIYNEQLALGSIDLESLQGAIYSSESGLLRRPISMLSFALNRHFFGIAPYSNKVVNLIIHLMNGIGIFLLSRLLLRGYRQFRNPDLPDQAMIWLPVVVSGLWLVHPLNLTSVLYIVQRMTSLATLFTLAGLCLYLWGRIRSLNGKHGLHLILTGFFVFGALAVFSKESGGLLPLYMLVLELTLFRFRNSQGDFDKAIIAFFVLAVALPACLVLLYLAIHPEFITYGYTQRNFTLTERLLTEGRVVVFYLKSILMPSITELGLYHDDITISHGLLDPPATLYSLLALAGMLLSAFLLLGRQPLVSLGILWFFTGHVLESTVIPLEIAHEHRNYLADYGIILAVASLVMQAPLRKLAPAIRIGAPCLFLLLFSYTTWLRASQWSDVVDQAVYEARHHPTSFRSVFSAGRIYARLALNGKPDFAKQARDQLLRAADLNKAEVMSYSLLIQFNSLMKQPVNPEWYDEIFHRMSSYPVSPSTTITLRSFTKCAEIKCGVPDEMIEKMFSLVFNNESLRYNHARLAEAKTIYGYYTINTRGNPQKGRELFTQAVKLSPRNYQYRENLVNLLVAMGEYNDAQQQLELLKTKNTYGGNDALYNMLQNEINAARKSRAASTLHESPESS
jgi:tetratricopeptide (TPR) repeat protein